MQHTIESTPNIWNELRYQLVRVYGEGVDEFNFAPIQPKITDDTLYLNLPKDVDHANFAKLYLPRMVNILKRKAPSMKLKLIKSQDSGSTQAQKQDKSASSSLGNDLNPRWVFNNYVSDTSNEMAISVAKNFVQNKEQSLLFLQAGVGHGKSHLLYATAKAWSDANPDKTMKVISAAKFTYAFVHSLQNRKEALEFHNDLRKLDALFFDDLHFVADKKATANALFQGIDELITDNKQVMITSKTGIGSLSGLDDWMRSRLNGGLSLSINSPSADLRSKISHLHARNKGIILTPDIENLLVNDLPGSLRELRGAIERLTFYVNQFGQESLTLARVKEVLIDMLRETRKPKLAEIRKCVANYYDLSIDDLCSQRRLRSISRPRQIGMYLSKQLTDRSLPEIGRCFGKRDHTTVIYAVRQIDNLRKKDSEMQETISMLTEMLREIT